MEILSAKTAGFCFGVKRAIDIAFDVAKKKRGGVFTFGPIIHNPQVVERLRAEGVSPVEYPVPVPAEDISALIIRTHGVPLNTMKRLSTGGYEIIDATCPFVKKAQYYAKLLSKEGYQVVILGDREHPEVKGLISYAGKGALVVRPGRKLPPLKGRLGFVVQTTQRVEALKELLSQAVEQAKEIKVYNTICSSTAGRLKEAGEMARKVGVMIIVGGKNSANTTQLAAHCKGLFVPTHHIETAGELERHWFEGHSKVGITAGASTPEWIIKDVEKRIKYMGGRHRRWNLKTKSLKNSMPGRFRA